jgi:hypothetical protein
MLDDGRGRLLLLVGWLAMLAQKVLDERMVPSDITSSNAYWK